MGEKFVDKMRPNFTNRPLISLPVPVGDQQQRKQPNGPQPSFWHLCSNWVRYHSIQWRWDIERFLARSFHRRWGG